MSEKFTPDFSTPESLTTAAIMNKPTPAEENLLRQGLYPIARIIGLLRAGKVLEQFRAEGFDVYTVQIKAGETADEEIHTVLVDPNSPSLKKHI